MNLLTDDARDRLERVQGQASTGDAKPGDVRFLLDVIDALQAALAAALSGIVVIGEARDRVY